MAATGSSKFLMPIFCSGMAYNLSPSEPLWGDLSNLIIDESTLIEVLAMPRGL